MKLFVLKHKLIKLRLQYQELVSLKLLTLLELKSEVVYSFLYTKAATKYVNSMIVRMLESIKKEDR